MTCRHSTRGFGALHTTARNAARELHEALTEAAFSPVGDEASLAAIERAMDRNLAAFNALAAWDRGPILALVQTQENAA